MRKRLGPMKRDRPATHANALPWLLKSFIVVLVLAGLWFLGKSVIYLYGLFSSTVQ
jgi:hypothetical protein